VDRSRLEGAFERIEAFLQKKVKNLLVVEDNPAMQADILNLIGNGDVQANAVETGEAAIQEIARRTYDCVILDLKLPDISGFDVLRRLEADDTVVIPPIVIYTGREITREEEFELAQYTSSIIVKGVRSQERLLDETALFLHRVVDQLPPEKQKMIARIYEGDTAFAGKHVLVVDDDMRNLYAISKILEERGMFVHKGADGKKALEALDRHPEMDLVLMDIMMPEMDGYEAIQRIRGQPRFQALPILAVTAKAMKDDRDKCIDAGADDYLAKPVDMDRLLSLMRVWLIR
jgi:CheY-like chemotaxis protein